MKCVTHQIQMEEVFHIDDMWTNTGQENIYLTAQSLYNQDEDLLYSIGIITTPIHGGRIVSCERGVVARFLGCRSRESEKIAILSKLCINTVITNCNERGIEKLLLPNALKKGINNNLHSNERNIGNRVLKGVRRENYPQTKKNSVRATFYRGPGCFFFTTFPKEKLRNMAKFVSVQILRSMKIGSQTHREPCGWFRFGEGGEFHRVTEIFIRYLQIHLGNRNCCKNSNSQIDIIF